MPRYCFDIDDGRRNIADKEGSDLPDRQQAREEAISIVLEFARDGLLRDDQRTVLCHVRDETGALILTASLSLNAKWNSGQTDLGT